MRVFELTAPVKVVSRSSGRSAVAAAAYRAGAAIEDERTGIVHDYTRKQGVEDTALLLPENAPDWAHDRAKLWNEAEAREKHPRAQTARDLTVAFPFAFNAEQRREAGLKVGQWIVFRHGVAVDIAWHEPSRSGDERNHHAHFLFTTRRFDENGQWAATKDRTLDDLKKGPEEISALRLAVADVLNNIAARDNLPVYAEHLSYERRGIDREPTQHLGHKATELEREGVPTDIGEKNRAIRQRNGERERLQGELKVIDIEIARERLRARQQEEMKHGGAEDRQTPDGQAPSPAPEFEAAAGGDPYENFYRETFARRAAFLEQLERTHADREKQLREQIAGISGAMANLGVFSRVWRNLTGRTRADLDQIADATRQLQDIHGQRQAAQENFERERRQRLEDLKESERLKALRREAALAEALQEPLARASGEAHRPREAPAPAPTSPPPTAEAPQASLAPASAPPATNYEQRRREYFRRVAAARKAERAREEDRQPPDRKPEPSAAPAPAANDDAAARPEPGSAYERARQRYARQRQRERDRPQERERDSGPTHEP